MLLSLLPFINSLLSIAFINAYTFTFIFNLLPLVTITSGFTGVITFSTKVPVINKLSLLNKLFNRVVTVLLTVITPVNTVLTVEAVSFKVFINVNLIFLSSVISAFSFIFT